MTTSHASGRLSGKLPASFRKRSAANRGKRSHLAANGSLPKKAKAVISETLIERCGALYSAVVSDILDKLGYRSQVMAPRIRPLFRSAKIAGIARTVLAQPVDGPPADPADNYRSQIRAIESMRPGHVMVVSSIETCIWGELLSLASRNQGARGIVIDGYTRDCEGIIELGFPTFAAGIHVADALGRIDVVEHGGEISSGDVIVRDGDIILGDYDGVVVIPGEITETVIDLAEEKVNGEDTVRDRLREGMPISEAFAKYGIL
jgi:4-hydroxy-4-methyl-2-oxoglutarate aldolase